MIGERRVSYYSNVYFDTLINKIIEREIEASGYILF